MMRDIRAVIIVIVIVIIIIIIVIVIVERGCTTVIIAIYAINTQIISAWYHIYKLLKGKRMGSEIIGLRVMWFKEGGNAKGCGRIWLEIQIIGEKERVEGIWGIAGTKKRETPIEIYEMRIRIR